jgi:hypothetical protein
MKEERKKKKGYDNSWMPRDVVNDFLSDKINKSEYIELAIKAGVQGKRAFNSAEWLERKLKWKGIKQLKSYTSQALLNYQEEIKKEVEKLVVHTPEEVANLNRDLDSRTQQDLYSSSIGYTEAIKAVLSILNK